MNHDIEHCADYDEDKCPDECIHAQRAQELKLLSKRWTWEPVKWRYLYGTQECERDVE